VESERLRLSGADLTARDGAVLAAADRALRSHMMQQVQTILATFEVSRSPTVTE
jgi:hypothetical protein